MEAKLAIAVIGFGLAAVTAAVRGAAWLVRKISQRRRPAQAPVVPPQQPAAAFTPQPAPAPAPAAMPAGVTINVTVNNASTAPAPAAPPADAEAPEPATRRRSPAQILAVPDHGIYLTTGSTFMVAHPQGERLLEQLDRMLFIAAHRDGDPWTLPPQPDTSTPLAGAAQITRVVAPDDGFDPCPVRALPAADNARWLARAGYEHARAAGS